MPLRLALAPANPKSSLMTHTPPTPHPTPDRGLRWTFLSSTNIFLMTLGGGRARLCPRAWIAPNRCWGRGRGMLFPARDFFLEFKREGSFQSPLKMYFSLLNNGLLSAPGGTRLRSRFCCRGGETSGFRAGKLSSERGSSLRRVFRSSVSRLPSPRPPPPPLQKKIIIIIFSLKKIVITQK